MDLGDAIPEHCPRTHRNVGVTTGSGRLLVRTSESLNGDLFGNAKNEANRSPRVSSSTCDTYLTPEVQLGNAQFSSGGSDEG